MDGFGQLMHKYQSAVNPADQAANLLHSMMNDIYEGFNTFHNQVLNIRSSIGNVDIKHIFHLEHATQAMTVHLQSVAHQAAQHQGPGPTQQNSHKKGILELKVIQNINPLTGDKGQSRQWHQKLINALSTINEDHAEIIKTIENPWTSETRLRTPLTTWINSFI